MMRLTLILAGLYVACLQPAGAAGFENLAPKPPAPKPVAPQVVPEAQPKSPPVTPTVAAPASPVEPPASAVSGPAAASTPSNPAKPASKPAFTPRGSVAIQSDGGFEYNGETGRVIYRKNVLVEDPANDPRTTISCEWLTTILPPPGEKIGEIIALTNVVITIKDTKGLQIVKGARAVYNATNDIVVITGSPIVEMPSGILLGDERIIYSRATETFEAPGKIRMIARPGGQAAVADLLRGTNAPKSAASSTVTNTPPKP
ncbi:MAG: hypothetical protein JNN07_11820 [Verrucomicrobiales bacterium]|nr:hypothetical protein [Verrucomicrobiales bacterium]